MTISRDGNVSEAVHDDLVEDYKELLKIARELAAKHIRGNTCTFCGSAAYNAPGAHNQGCKVKELENYS